MEDFESHVPGKYSEVTGEKIKKKSVRKVKKEHKVNKKKTSIEEKKLSKKKKKFDKKITKMTASVEAKTLSKSNLEIAGQSTEADASMYEGNKKPKVVQTEQEKVLIIRKSETGKPVSKKRKFMNFMSYALVGLVAIFFGYFAGNFYVANYLNKVDYSQFSEASLRDDAQAVYQTLVNSGRSPDSFSAIELFVASEYVLSIKENYTTQIVGEIQPSIGSVQSIWGYKNKVGNKIICENLSIGMLPVAEKYEYDIETQTALVYKASDINGNQASYPSNPTWTLDYNAYREEYGTAPDNPCVPYIISSKTVIPGTEKVTSIEGGKYKLTFSVTTDSSVLNYVKQMKHMSGLKDYPTFKAINITAVIDSNYNFLSLRFDESYSVMYFGVMASCTGFLETTLSY